MMFVRYHVISLKMVTNYPFCKIRITLKPMYILLFISVEPKLCLLPSFCPRVLVFCLFLLPTIQFSISGVQCLDFFSVFIPLVVVIWVSYKSGACFLGILSRAFFGIPMGKPHSVPRLYHSGASSSALDTSIMPEGMETSFTS